MEAAGNYHSGDDYVVEFLGYRFSFSSLDFEGRVTAAADRLSGVADRSATMTTAPSDCVSCPDATPASVVSAMHTPESLTSVS